MTAYNTVACMFTKTAKLSKKCVAPKTQGEKDVKSKAVTKKYNDCGNSSMAKC